MYGRNTRQKNLCAVVCDRHFRWGGNCRHRAVDRAVDRRQRQRTRKGYACDHHGNTGRHHDDRFDHNRYDHRRHHNHNGDNNDYDYHYHYNYNYNYDYNNDRNYHDTDDHRHDRACYGALRANECPCVESAAGERVESPAGRLRL